MGLSSLYLVMCLLWSIDTQQDMFILCMQNVDIDNSQGEEGWDVEELALSVAVLEKQRVSLQPLNLTMQLYVCSARMCCVALSLL